MNPGVSSSCGAATAVSLGGEDPSKQDGTQDIALPVPPPRYREFRPASSSWVLEVRGGGPGSSGLTGFSVADLEESALAPFGENTAREKYAPPEGKHAVCRRSLFYFDIYLPAWLCQVSVAAPGI